LLGADGERQAHDGGDRCAEPPNHVGHGVICNTHARGFAQLHGRERQRTEREVKPAIAAALVAVAAVGAACRRHEKPPPGPVTFTKDIAPIVFANCASCHRPGGVGPFSLLSYADAAGNADEIAEQTLAGHMPPWQPSPGEFPIVGERRLRPEQIDTIQRWVKGGRLEGNPADLPAAPVFTAGWELGQPDAAFTVARPYVVKPGREDVYRNLVIPTRLASDVFVRAVEFRTGGAPIHHAVIRVDSTSASARRDAADSEPGFEGMAWDGVRDPEGQFLGWAPGRGPIASPDGMPWRLERGAALVVEMHVLPGDEAIPIKPEIGLFLTSTPPVRTPFTVRMGSKIIDIPAGKADYIVTDSYDVPVPVELLSVYPHAHYLGAEMLVTATLPGGNVKRLLHIHDWSFHWQQDYRYVTPIALPAGTRLTMRYTYDNSEKNPDNPSRPPVRVRAGPKSTDEMAELGLQMLPRTRQDAARILADFDDREKRANIALGESRVREEPNVAEYRAVLGGSYVEGERFADAIPHLEAALRLGDRSAAVHNYLGVALMEQGRAAEAVPLFRRAAALDPRDERLPFNLGNALGRLRRPAEAATAYERALAINPDFPDAHVNLAVLFSSYGHTPQALAHYAKAVALRPDSAFIHSNYGGALAAAGRYSEALRHVLRALELEPGYPPAADNLRRLQQMGIR
jgi:tetratricopeptide (TPR) repeat protein/mono/diheme cytochrome c family protein